MVKSFIQRPQSTWKHYILSNVRQPETPYTIFLDEEDSSICKYFDMHLELYMLNCFIFWEAFHLMAAFWNNVEQWIWLLFTTIWWSAITCPILPSPKNVQLRICEITFPAFWGASPFTFHMKTFIFKKLTQWYTKNGRKTVFGPTGSIILFFKSSRLTAEHILVSHIPEFFSSITAFPSVYHYDSKERTAHIILWV